MESWSYSSEGKGLMFSDQIDFSSVDALTRSRKELTGWDKGSVESLGFIDLSFSEVPKRPFQDSNAGVGNFGVGEVGSDSGKLVVTSPTCIIGSNSSLESGSNHSNSFMESNSQDASLIDLKLGRLVDRKGSESSMFYEERSVVSSVNKTVQAKRARTISSHPQTPFCQVYGCNKDLSFSKDYHKRHKVCEIHSKTSKVIVNGIEQRFCQQCSRFHLLVEFDDGKRSCRKRLAGHNERRRKPQFSTLSLKPHKFLHSHQGTKFLGTSLPKRASFLFQNIPPGNFLYPEKCGQSSWSRNVKMEQKETYNPLLAVSIAHGQSAKSSLHLHSNGIQCTPGISSPVTKDHTVSNTASANHELAGVLHSSCALSLLSAESQDPNYSSGNELARPPLISQAGCVHHSLVISDRPSGMVSSEKYVPDRYLSSEKYVPDGYLSSEMISVEANHVGSRMVSDNHHATNCQVKANGFVHGSDFFNPKYSVSPEHGSDGGFASIVITSSTGGATEEFHAHEARK